MAELLKPQLSNIEGRELYTSSTSISLYSLQVDAALLLLFIQILLLLQYAGIFQPDNNWHPYTAIFIWNEFFALLVSQTFF